MWSAIMGTIYIVVCAAASQITGLDYAMLLASVAIYEACSKEDRKP